MNQRESIIQKIEELQNYLIQDSKNNASASELAEYLVKVNKLQILLEEIAEKNIKK